MNGFGDFSIVGDQYSIGGPAYAVAIHLTYLNEEKDMYVRHFISDRNESPSNPGGKFKEALNKLILEINEDDSSMFHSSACDEFIALYNREHYPGLGYSKKLSMQHHLELIADYNSK